jgi:hypothetical protein
MKNIQVSPLQKCNYKFMIIRYRLQSIYYVCFVENKQRKNIQVNTSNILLSTSFKILARARAQVNGLVFHNGRGRSFRCKFRLLF